MSASQSIKTLVKRKPLCSLGQKLQLHPITVQSTVNSQEDKK